ncbi:MAG TPA: hypothetical protein PKD53_29485, partial [Chloroflexaceae bacterium]|nr:hypothetical protein [Chloroflexaceae bacterium]
AGRITTAGAALESEAESAGRRAARGAPVSLAGAGAPAASATPSIQRAGPDEKVKQQLAVYGITWDAAHEVWVLDGYRVDALYLPSLVEGELKIEELRKAVREEAEEQKELEIAEEGERSGGENKLPSSSLFDDYVSDVPRQEPFRLTFAESPRLRPGESLIVEEDPQNKNAPDEQPSSFTAAYFEVATQLEQPFQLTLTGNTLSDPPGLLPSREGAPTPNVTVAETSPTRRRRNLSTYPYGEAINLSEYTQDGTSVSVARTPYEEVSKAPAPKQRSKLRWPRPGRSRVGRPTATGQPDTPAPQPARTGKPSNDETGKVTRSWRPAWLPRLGRSKQGEVATASPAPQAIPPALQPRNEKLLQTEREHAYQELRNQYERQLETTPVQHVEGAQYPRVKPLDPTYYAGEKTQKVKKGIGPRAYWRLRDNNPLGPDAPVRYLSREVADKQYKLTRDKQGGGYTWRGGEGFTTEKMTQRGGASNVQGRAIFVLSADGTIYAADQGAEVKKGLRRFGKKVKSLFHHSSFLAGEPVAAAGELEFKEGVLTKVTDISGHYRPGLVFTRQILKKFQDDGINLSAVRLHLGKKEGFDEALEIDALELLNYTASDDERTFRLHLMQRGVEEALGEGDWQAAHERAERAWKLDATPDPADMAALGRAFMGAGQYVLAETWLARAGDSGADPVANLLNLAQVQLLRGANREATDTLAKAFNYLNSPLMPDVSQLYGLAVQNQRDFKLTIYE